MRTVIFFGLMSIADAIQPHPEVSKGLVIIGAVIFIACIIMDLLEFFKNTLK